MSTTTQPPKPKRRWYQFSLKTEDEMKRLTTCMLLIALLLPNLGLSRVPGCVDDKEAAIAAIKKLRGRVKLDRNKVVVHVKLSRTKVTDTGLEHLKGLAKLEWLFLDSTKVTGTGLKHLKGLKSLQWLNLNSTKVTDAGLEHLKGLTKLDHPDTQPHQGHGRWA